MPVPVFESFYEKNVKVKQKDGFFKYGVLVGEDATFLSLRFRDGRRVNIAKSEVEAVEEVKG